MLSLPVAGGNKKLPLFFYDPFRNTGVQPRTHRQARCRRRKGGRLQIHRPLHRIYVHAPAGREGDLRRDRACREIPHLRAQGVRPAETLRRRLHTPCSGMSARRCTDSSP